MNSVKCKAKRADGEPCGAWAQGEQGYCFMHDPDRAAERATARKLGGYRNRPPHAGNLEGLPAKIRSLEDVLALLDYTLAELAVLDNSIVRARGLIALAAEYRAALIDSDLEQRVAALEAARYGQPNKTS